MELQFQPQQLQGLKPLLQEIQTSEQTQELRIPDGMPDVCRVIDAWGQSILRSKQWHGDHISCTCGMQIWALYEPEGDGQLQVVSSWIPFSMQWDLEEGAGEGSIRVNLLTRFVDARTTSPRKLMIRAGMGALAEVMAPCSWKISTPREQKEIPALVKKHTVRVWKEAGEKELLLDEELILPESVPAAKTLIYCSMEPHIGECRVLGDKVAFRGHGKVHVVYADGEDQVYSWDFETPFSQYAHLSDRYANDADCDIRLAITSMEPELEVDGKLRMKCALTGQYLISDRESFQVLEDAYHPDREVELIKEELVLPSVPNRERKSVTVQGKHSATAQTVTDSFFWPDFSTISRNNGGILLSMSGSFRTLCYGPDGKLNASTTKWEEKESMEDFCGSGMVLLPQVSNVHASLEADSVRLKAEMSLSGYPEQLLPFAMVTEASLGEGKAVQEKPSLILMRCGKESIWEIAKRTGSRIEDIRETNALEGECEQGMLLLIPLGK